MNNIIQHTNGIKTNYMMYIQMTRFLESKYGTPKIIYQTTDYTVYELYQNIYSKWEGKRLVYNIAVVYKNTSPDLFKHILVSSNVMDKKATIELRNTEVKRVKEIAWEEIKKGVNRICDVYKGNLRTE